MKRIYTTIALLLLTIISFGQTWEKIEVPDSTINDVAIDSKGQLNILTPQYLFVKQEDKIQQIKNNNDYFEFLYKKDSLLLHSRNGTISYFNGLTINKIYNISYNGGYYPKALVTQNGSILTDCVSDSICIVRFGDKTNIQDTVLKIPFSKNAFLRVFDILQSLNGNIYVAIGSYNGDDGGLYESVDDGVTWNKIVGDYSVAPLWIVGNEIYFMHSGAKHYNNGNIEDIEFYSEYSESYESQILVDTNNVIYVAANHIGMSSNGLWENITYNLNDIGSNSKLIIGQNGYLYLITRDWNLIDNKVKYVNHLYRLSEPIYKSSNTTTAINENTHTDNILNGTFRLYSVTGTYFGTAEIQNSDLSELKERVKKGVYILQNIATKQVAKVVLQ